PRRVNRSGAVVDGQAGGSGPGGRQLLPAGQRAAPVQALHHLPGPGQPHRLMPRLLVVTAVAAEADAVLGRLARAAGQVAGLGVIDADPDLRRTLAQRTGAPVGTVLTVATVTGRAERAAALLAAHPAALAEGMEGFGVAAAAHRAGVRFGELRAVSNPVGPR